MSFRLRRLAMALLLLIATGPLVFGQTATPLSQVSLPAFVMAGASCNQLNGCAGFISGIIPETTKAGGFYGSITADLAAVKFTEPTTGKIAYGISPNIRFGEHKVVHNNGKTMFLIGGDFGASFSNTSPATSSISVGLAGSFTATVVYQLSDHWAVGMPIRMLWVSGVGPNGNGVWNPVLEAGVIWKP